MNDILDNADTTAPHGAHGSPLVAAFDIETDTATGGLDPQLSAAVTIAVATATEELVFSDIAGERDLICTFDEWLRQLDDGVVASWGGARFDVPFLWTRAAICGVRLDWSLIPDGPVVKYTPITGHDGQYVVKFHDRLGHRDIEIEYRDAAEAGNVRWGLKPVAQLFGMDPIEVDTANLHLLSAAEVIAYNASDARVTFDLAARLDD